MATWSSGYTCTDCGREIARPGTCADCLIKNQPVPAKLKRDINKGRRKGDKVKRNG